MTTPITFFVPGLPAPGGSKKAFYVAKLGRAVVTDAAGERNREWKQNVRVFARENYTGPILDEALSVKFQFVMPRPKDHFRTNGQLKPKAPAWHTKKPDSTKLARSTEDALTGIIWRDDTIVCRLNISKGYGDRPGVHVTISPLSPKGEAC